MGLVTACQCAIVGYPRSTRPAERRTVTKSDTRLTPRQRLTRGLQYTAVGPVDITRGTVGLGMHGVYSAGSGLRRRYRDSRVAQELSAAQETVARELAAAQEVVAALPEVLAEARQP